MSFCVLDAECIVYDDHSRMAGLSHGRTLCQGCRDRCRADLNLLRYDYVDLTQLLPPADVRNELGKIWRPKPESRSPVNDAALHLRGQIAWLVFVVADEVRRAAGTRHSRAAPVREGFALDHDVRYLLERVDELAALPPVPVWTETNSMRRVDVDGAGLVLALRRLHHRARQMCGTEPKTITVPGWCPRCLTSSLRRHDDDPEKIWCVHCKQKMTAAEYGQAVRLQVPIDADTPG